MGVSLLTRSDSQPQRFSNDTQRCQAFLTKPRSPTSSLLHHHRHHQPPGCQGPAPSPQSWTSFSTKASTWPTKTRKGFSGNSTLRPEFQHLATIIQGLKFKAILKLAPPMCPTCQGLTSVTLFPAAILVIQSTSTSIAISISSGREAVENRFCP